MSQNANTQKVSNLGVSIWLDDLSRARLNEGSLEKLIAEKNVVGVTTNPSIFQAAIVGKDDYAEQLASLKAEGKNVDEVVRALTTDDVRRACDVFKGVYEASQFVDGRVSIEVDPRLAHDGEGTAKQAVELYNLVDRENVMIKIPAIKESLPAITATLAEGISVNVTLIFTKERYLEVIDAFIAGIAKAKENGKDLSKIHSVASFFVSRVDSAVDKVLDAKGTSEALELRGKVAVANAQVAYAAYENAFATDARWAALEAAGAAKQRPLWASTGVKNPDYSPTLYVDELAGANVVNTMPEKTLNAVADGSIAAGDNLVGKGASAEAIVAAVEAQGVDLAAELAELERDGVEKFIASWSDLLNDVSSKL